jgi:GNAT superfamily N-acetyltransferase
MDRLCLPSDAPCCLHDAKWWVAKVEGVTAAYGGAKVLLGENVAYLCRAGVLSQFRGQGLQLALIRRRVRWARGLGLREVITDTSLDNVASSNNLMKAGFRLYLPEHPWGLPVTNYWHLKL